MMTTSRSSVALAFAVLLGAAMSLAACGDDDAPAKPAKPKAAKAAPARAKATPKGRGKKRKTAPLETYARIDEKYRRELKDQDFLPDLSGDERRDPFQSFVVRQGVGNSLSSGQVAIQPTETCTDKNTKAPGFQLHDLRLIGIVLRGTRGYAQFRDRAGFGWIVRRGDCLGKEKALVQAIGAGSVTLEVIPETPPNAPPPTPQRQDIALYPEDLEPVLSASEPAPEATE